MATSSIDQITPPVGPNIVRAWFDTAINPLLLGLENEHSVLTKHTFTWREHNGQMITIRSVWGHVPYTKWANFEQFLSFYGDIAGLCKAHDIRVVELAQACQRVFEALFSSTEFRDFVAEACESPLLKLNPGQTKEMFAKVCESDQDIRWLVQNVVNGTELVGRGNEMAPIWDPFREAFLSFRRKEPIRGLWEEADRQGQQLLEIVEELISALKDARNSLSLKFDVPPEPLDERE